MPSYLSYKKQMSVLDAKDDNVESWITVKGNHIPIMKGQTKAEAIQNFVEKKQRQNNEKDDDVIRHTSPKFGSAGKYEVFRSGNLEAPSGFVFTAPKFNVANSYSSEEHPTVEKYHTEIKNPLVVKGSSDVENMKLVYKKLFGRDFPKTKNLDAITWPKYDKMIANKLAKTKYDAIITYVDDVPREIQIPKGNKLELVKSYNRIAISENEELKMWDKEYKDASKRYWDFVDNMERNNEEHQRKAKKLQEEMFETLKVRNKIQDLLIYQAFEESDKD